MTKCPLIALMVLLSIVATTEVQAKDKSKQSTNQSAQARSRIKQKSKVSKGRLLIGVYDCLSCHSLDGEGNKEGVALDHLKRSRSFLIEHILAPETHVEKNPTAYANEPNLMPSYQLSREEAADIADYLLGSTRNKRKKENK